MKRPTWLTKPVAFAIAILLTATWGVILQSSTTSDIRTDADPCDQEIEPASPGEPTYDYIDADLVEVIEDIGDGLNVELPVFEDVLTFDLDLVSIFESGAVEIDSSDNGPSTTSPVAKTYRGTVAGVGGSSAYLTLDEDYYGGVVFLPDATHYIDKNPDYPGGSEQRFRASMTTEPEETADWHEWTPWEGNDTDSHTGPGCYAPIPKPPVGNAELMAINGGNACVGTTVNVVLSVVADWDYWNNHQGDWSTGMQDKVNQASGLYQSNCDIKISFTMRHVTAERRIINNPLTSTNSATLLNQFACYMRGVAPNSACTGSPAGGFHGSNFAGQYQIAHLFTGKLLLNNVLGTSWRPLATNPNHVSYGHYSLSMQGVMYFWAGWMAGPESTLSLLAHELGHNFDGTHEASYCTNPGWWWPWCTRFSVMWTPLNQGSTLRDFSDANANAIRAHASKGFV